MPSHSRTARVLLLVEGLRATAMRLEEIRDFYRLSDRIGTAGQPTCEQFDAVADAGYEVVLNLAPFQADSGALASEAEVVTARGMEYVHIPVDWSAPRPEDAEAFFAAMRAHAGRKLFVHCIANRRVSAFLYLYRILCEDVPEAVAAYDLHRLWTPEGVWAEFMTVVRTGERQGDDEDTGGGRG